ncbi:hypothetical protein LTR74_012295 [Friedmanniomyces endolithicus]|nr:hypothetical protein LTR74_012295 [Friedmanniomyces endolithicus]
MDSYGFTTSSPDDRRAWLWTIGLLSCIYSSLSLAARLTSKWELLWYDDALLGVGYAFAYAHYGALYRAISAGLGAVTSQATQAAIEAAAENFFAARSLFLLAHCLSKVSMVAFTRRIFSGNLYGESLACWIAFVATGGFGVVALLVSAVGCHPSQSLSSGSSELCRKQVARWAVISTYDVLTELLLIILPIWFASKTEISATQKRVVALAFAFRLAVAAFSIATTVTYLQFLRGGTDSVGLAPTVAWMEVTLCTSLLTASVPSLRSFLSAFLTRGTLTMYGVDTVPATSRSGSIPMRSLERSGHATSPSTNGEWTIGAVKPESRLRPGWMEYKVDIQGTKARRDGRTNAESESVKSDGSENQMIIRRQAEFEVHEER